MSTLDDLVKKYGSSSTPAKKKKNTSTTGLDGLYNKLGLETPEYSYSNPYESDPYALAVDEAYNRVNNSNLLSSAEDRRQLSAREKYAQRDNESNRQRNNYGIELPKPTVQKDTSSIGELEDRLLEEKKRTNYTPAQKAERDRRESEYQDYAELQKLNNLLNDDNENWFTNGKDYDEVKRQRDELQFKVDSSSQRDKQEAWDNEYQRRMSAAMTAADFSEKSKPDYSSLDPTYLQINEGKMKKDDIEGYVNTYLSPELKDKDAWLDSLDVSSGVKSRIKAEAERRSTEKTYDTDYNYNPTNKSNSGEGTERYEYLTRDEKRVYNYLHSQSTEKADEFLDFLWDTLGERLAEAERQEIESFTKALPGVSDIVSVPLNLVGGATGLVDLAKQTANHWLTGAPIDTNSAAMRFASTGQEIRNVRSQQLENLAPNANVLGINVLSGLYNTAMSGLDSAAAGYLGKGISSAVNSARPIGEQIAREIVYGNTDKLAAGITEAILSGTAATQAARDVKARGGNDNQILLGALSAGIFEALFENLSIETLPAFAEVPWKDWRSVAGNVAKSFITNASEEMNTELANILFDTFAMGNASEYADSLRKYMAEGLSFEKAKKAVIKDFAVRVGESGASGGLMGIGFGITSSLQGRSAARQTGHALQTNADRSAFTALLADGLKADKSSDFGKLARDIKAKIDAKQSVSDLDVGKLYNLKYAEETESAPQNAYNAIEQTSALLQSRADANEREASKWANIGDELAADTFREEAQQNRADSKKLNKMGLKLPTVQNMARQDFLARRNAENQNAYTPAEREAARSAAEYNANLALQNEAQNNIIKAQQTAESAENNAALSEGATLAEARNAAQANAEPHTVTPRRLELPTVKESTNGREVYLRNGSERVNSTNPGEQVRAVENAPGRDQSRQTLRFARDRGAVNVTYSGEAKTARELTGLSVFDNSNRAYHEVTGNLSPTMQEAKDELAPYGINLRFYIGGNFARNDGKPIQACINGKDMWVRADHPDFTSKQFAGHEFGHHLIDTGRISPKAIKETLETLTSPAFVRGMINEYGKGWNEGRLPLTEEAVAHMYAEAFDGSDLTVEEVWDEIICDAIGKLNRFEAIGEQTTLKSTADTLLQYIRNEAEAQRTRAPPAESKTVEATEGKHNREFSGEAKTAMLDAKKAERGESVKFSKETDVAAYKDINLANDATAYTYDFLTSRSDMAVTGLPPLSEIVDKNGRFEKRAIVDRGIKNALSLGKESDGKVYVTNNYTGRMMRIDNGSIRHGLAGNRTRLFTNARLGSVIGDVVKNGIPINALQNEAKDVVGTYALANYATDADGREYVAIVTVEQKSGNVDGVEVYDVTHAVNGRQRKADRSATKAQSVNSPTVGTISIADLLQVVNSTHRSILSDDVLNHFGEERDEKGYYTGKVLFSREFDADLFDVNEDIRKRIADIQDELAKTKRHELYWKGQTKRTTAKSVREADINKLAKRLIKSYSSTLEAADIAGDLQALGNYIVNDGDAKNELTYEDIRDRADAISKKIVENALAESEGNDAGSYRELRSYLRDQTLRLPAENKADLIDYAAFKKANPALKVSTKSGLEVDAAYMELQSKLGKAFFPDDITNPADQLMRIADVVNELKPVYDNPYDYQQAEAIEYISSDILDSLLSEEVRQTPPTFADRKAAEIERVRGNYKQKIAALQEQAQQRVDNLRVRKNEQIEALKEYYAEQKQEARERRADADARTKLLKIARRLNNKKLPLVMKAQLAQYVGELDLVAKSMTGKTLDKLTALKDWYETQKEELGEDFIKDEAIEKKLDRLSKKRINDLTASEVADLTQVLQFFEASIIEANKFKNSKIKEDRYAAGMRVVWDVQNARPGKINWQLRPSSAAMRMVGYDDTSPLATAMDEMIEGERQYDLYQREAVKPYEKWINNKRFMKSFSGKDARMLTIKGTGVNGNEVTQQLTPAMLVEMYLASRNEDNMRHYQRGYAVFPNMELYRKGDIDEAYNKTNKVSIKRSAILEAAKQLTQEELAFASAITNYYNNFAPKRLNETSLIIDGYEKFNEENYYPIVSDNKFLNQDYESLDEKGNNSSLAQPGFGKERTHASNPAIVRDANLTLMQQIRMNGRYATMAIPLQNMSRLLNVKGKGMTTSVREALTNQYSSSADAYLKKFMRDYAGQNAAKERGLDPILKKIRSSYAGGVLALSAGTAIKQAASYPTAAAVTGAVPLLKAMNPAMKADVSFIDELTAAFTKRTQGFSSMELGDLASINKSLPKALNWIQAVDVGTTKLLKRAAYFAVRSESPNLKVGSDGFKRAVVNKYVEIIEKTQPNYSVALRPEVLRSNSEIVRTISMFMTQPLQNYNILYDAFGNYAAKKAAWQNTHSAEAKAALNDAKKQVIRATSSQFVAALVFALMQFGWDRLRGKDKKYKEDGKLTLGSFAKGTGLNMLTSGAGMFVGGKTALELAESIADGIIKNAGGDTFFDQSFYGLESAELGAITDAGKAALNLTKLVGDIVKKSATGEDIDWEASVRKLLTGAGSIGVMFGVPVDNVTKDVQAFARSILHTMGNISGDPVKGDFLAKRIVDSEASEYYDQLYKYYKTDRDKFAEYYNLMLEYKVSTADKIKEKMEKLMREDAGVPGVKDLEKRFLVGEEEKTYDELMSVAEKGKLRWKGSTEGQAIAWKKAKEFAYDVATGDEDAEAKAQAAGVSYEDYISALLALGGEDKPTGDNKDKYGTYSQDEITAAVNSLTGLTRQERYTLWQALSGSDTDKNNPFRGNAPVKKNLKASTKTETAEEKTEEKPSTIDTSNSSMFSSATYKDGTLSLKFRGSGKTYTYNVPESVWEDMKNADSLGNFYNSRIKGKYSAA